MGTSLRRAAFAMGLLAAAVPAAQAQSGDVARGRDLFESRCGGCHSLDENRVGPALGTVVGRAAGKKADFAYSAALAAAGHVWTPDKLQAWLTDPEALVPGQAMGYRLSEAVDRRDVVAFLQSLAAGQPVR
ncbi:c-type cytochrome [Hydrogenophaga pseudoflava]|uniref:c-type cytochrome n=1 Tax=Hydrogenophaga pseudoflava TaxID=47421 RepID=UPI0027E5BBD8|nr:c-type cytochrome [Hydrogenophaga pseudoflava]MDQ7744844.1 c-type cytochrome [Hydrogenophaga pseudoflava]